MSVPLFIYSIDAKYGPDRLPFIVVISVGLMRLILKVYPPLTGADAQRLA
jgi:hypothetical protein